MRDSVAKICRCLVGERAAFSDGRKCIALGCCEIIEQLGFKLSDTLGGYVAKKIVYYRVDDSYLELNCDRRISVLLKHLNYALTLLKTRLCICVKVGSRY